MTTNDFLRMFPIRASNLMWLLGAGASASAGIPTATDLIWVFKRALFCADQRVSPKSCEDLSSATVRSRLNSYFDGQGAFPREGSPEEYAAYFEAAYPDANDRRRLLEGFLAGIKPSYGHLALAALMRMGRVRLVWTPNFDRLIEDAAVQFFGGTSGFVVGTLDNPSVVLSAINEGRWPVIAKMHGDFQSQRLKNTPLELRAQDAEMCTALLESSRRYGLVVAGYSGRDESILKALHEAAEAKGGFPGGLFWFKRSDSGVLPGVAGLIEKATRNGIQGELLEIQTFDEFLGDLFRQFADIPPEIETRIDRRAARLTGVPLGAPGRGWPVIRLNALPLTEWPTVCRRVVCEIGGKKSVRDAVAKADAKAVATRTRAGVLAFGSDREVRRAFAPFGIREFDCHSIEPRRLQYDSAELGLLRDSFARALESAGPFRSQRGRRSDVLHVDFARVSPRLTTALRACAGDLGGTVPGTTMSWSEVLRFRLDNRLGRLWMLIEPGVFLGETSDARERQIGADFVRERLVPRYNRQWNAFLEAWIALVMGGGQELHVAGFGVDDGMDARFTVGGITGFSRPSTET
jgi:NAD-dependent SIR2 family protein deacetylase